MPRTVSWVHYLALACGTVWIAAVLVIVIPAYGAIGLAPPETEFLWFPEIARGQQLSRAGWLVCGSSSACLWAIAGLRRASTLAERLALALAIGGLVLNAAVWIRYGSRMIHALSWDAGHEWRTVVHWFR
jgi:hypothetical protein